MRIVADTNTFLAVALEEPEKPLLIRLAAGHDLIAPEALPFELGNALTAMVKRRVLAPREVAAAWDAVQAVPVELRRINIRAALEIAGNLSLYAYDAYFLECAVESRAPLLTLDQRLKDAARKIRVELLG